MDADSADGSFVFTPDASITSRIEDATLTHFSVFPQPAFANQSIQIQGDFSESLLPFITDIQGKKINYISIHIQENNITIPPGSLMPGLYFLHIPESKHQTHTLKIIIQ
jgi:hypothetical protein